MVVAGSVNFLMRREKWIVGWESFEVEFGIWR